LVEKSDSEEFAYKFVTNPNPTEEPTTEPTTGSDVVITVVSGDVNLDNDVTIADAVLLNKYLVKSATLNEAQEAAADAYYDGKLDSTDTLTILKFIVGTYDQLPQKP
ncbi:MAG: dockerin type I repeat-containing protein, partial [Ruminococcus callidus]|nr:dockerin type I repeat-containing protein [Ruminococcus callidus]